MIELKNITKTYKVSKRNAGLKNAFKSYFKRDYEEVKALDDISFKIDEGETKITLRVYNIKEQVEEFTWTIQN